MEIFSGSLEGRGLRAVRNGAILGLTAVLLSGCYSRTGEGDEFVVKGRVTDPGRQSIKADIYEVDLANGNAKDWFSDPNPNHQIHDNCNCSFWGNEVTYGHVEDITGATIPLSEVVIGSCIEFDGKIRNSQHGKHSDPRPVYDVAKVIPC